MSIPRHLGKPRHELWCNDNSRTPVHYFKSKVFVFCSLANRTQWAEGKLTICRTKTNSVCFPCEQTSVVWMIGGNTNLSNCLSSAIQGITVIYTLCQLNRANCDKPFLMCQMHWLRPRLRSLPFTTNKSYTWNKIKATDRGKHPGQFRDSVLFQGKRSCQLREGFTQNSCHIIFRVS